MESVNKLLVLASIVIAGVATATTTTTSPTVSPTLSPTSMTLSPTSMSPTIAPTAPPTFSSITLGYSLLGEYSYVPAPGVITCLPEVEEPRVVWTFTGGKDVFTTITYQLGCQQTFQPPQYNGTFTVVKTQTSLSLSTWVCGQNANVGTLQGVIGGIFVDETNVTSNICLQFFQTQGNYNWGRVTKLRLTSYESPGTTIPVSCWSTRPTEQPIKVGMSGNAICNRGVCLDLNQAATCNGAGFTPTRDIGIGMSVGAIFMILITLGLVYFTPIYMKIQF